MAHTWNRVVCVVALNFAALVSFCARAEGLPAEEQAFFDKQISTFIQILPTRLQDAALVKVFAVPFYKVTVEIKDGDGGSQSVELVVARVEDKLVNVSRPGSDTNLPAFKKMLNPTFKLKTDDDAKAMQQAMDVAYPITGGDEDKKAKGFQHTGNRWTFFRGTFFDKKLGFVFEVDANGDIKSVKFSLKIP